MELVTLRELSEEFEIDISSMHKYAKKISARTLSIRPQGRGQKMSAVTSEEADRIRTKRIEDGFMPNAGRRETRTVNNPGTDDGEFYVVQLDPVVRRDRIKLGFARNASDRLADYHTSNPEAQLLRSWPCKRVWERAAMAAVTNSDVFQLVSGEVYDCHDLNVMFERANRFFGMMPRQSVTGTP